MNCFVRKQFFFINDLDRKYRENGGKLDKNKFVLPQTEKLLWHLIWFCKMINISLADMAGRQFSCRDSESANKRLYMH